MKAKRRREYKNRVDTRRLYRYEKKFLQRHEAQLPMKEVRALALRIWRGEGRDMRRLPKIITGKKLRYLGRWCSYCDYDNKREIVLVYRHCKALVLVHELVHAMGFFDHDRPFLLRYFHLLEKYCGYKREELIINAAWFGIRA